MTYRVFVNKEGLYGLFEYDPEDESFSGPVQDTYFATIADLRADVIAMLAACDQPVVDESE